MRHIHRQIVSLLFDAGYHNQCLAEVYLCLARRMGQRHKHLPGAELFATNIVLHDRVAAREPVFFLQPLEDPLRRMPLLNRPLLVIAQNGIDDTQPRAELGLLDRLLALVTWRHSVLQHLPHCVSRQAKLSGHRTLTLALDSYRSPNSSVDLHLEHPSGVP
jgi:hypothetical protein